jgi:hypothetical protein
MSLALIGPPASATPQAAAAASVDPTWSVVSSPNVGTLSNGLAGVAALSQTDAWAVGSYSFIAPGAAPVNKTLAEHWNGTTWSTISTPNVGTGQNDFNAVAAASASDAWAVGTFFEYTTLSWRTLIEHWNGTSWSVMASPSPSTRYNALHGVVAVAPNDVWAVGIMQTSGGGGGGRGGGGGGAIANRTLVEHWNGTAWSVVTSPNVGSGNNYLLGVAASSSTDVWAVGSHDAQTLVERWNGTKWSVVASPNVGTTANFFNAVAVVSGSDVWAVGAIYPGAVAPERTLAEHYNGTTWSVVASPNVGTGNNALQGVAALSSGDVWSVGVSYNSSAKTLTERWDGTAWTVVTSPSPGTEAHLSGVAALPASTVWSVGSFEQGPGRTLVLQSTNG